MTTLHTSIAVAGAGPAGMAAACAAMESGKPVLLLDDNFTPGGQIWRGTSHQDRVASRWLSRMSGPGVEHRCGVRVVDLCPRQRRLVLEEPDGCTEVFYQNLILATGARELFLPFPGWTLPGVTGAGGLQALVKSGLAIKGKRVLVAGSGPLLPAVAAALLHAGATIPAIVEQTSWDALAEFGLHASRLPGKFRQAAEMAWTLRGIRYLTKSWVIAVEGTERVERAVVATPGGRRTIACDYLAAGFGLIPNTELAQLAGCALQQGTVIVDEWQQTSCEGIWAAGEVTGIAGVEAALVEGQIAGYAAAGDRDRARALFGGRARYATFAAALARCFRLRDELRHLSDPHTVVCRCEDVLFSELQQHAGWRDAKLHTRCGMGPCQGRVCGPAAQFLFSWTPDSVRPPVFPARVETLVRQPQSRS
jgi:D-hydroxyproline dehydrogenase subunit alpha